MELAKKRLREFNLVKQSKLPFDEVEDWNALFQEKDEEGQGELQLHDVKDMVNSIGVKWDKEFSETIKEWVQEADQNNNGTIDFGEFCIVIGKMWITNLHDVRDATRRFMQKDTVVSLKTVHGRYISVNARGEMFASSTTSGVYETFTRVNLSNGNSMFRGANNLFVKATETQLSCTEENAGTQFKVTTMEDERVILTASTAFGGSVYADKDGAVAVSDGNPRDEPNFPLEIVEQEQLLKKRWSRILPKRKPSKLIVSRQASKQSTHAPADPLSPGIQAGIAEIDAALQDNMMKFRGA
jgi:hypothetical protein